MHNKNLNKYLRAIFYILLSIFFLITITIYTKHIELFNKYEIQINGNEFVSKEIIKERIIKHLNKGYFSIDLDIIKSNINSLNFVEFTQISLLFPNKLIIHIIEREPIILITLDNKNYLMDKNALLLPTEAHSINYFPVPIINLQADLKYDDNLIFEISQIFNYLLVEYPFFYNRLSEVIIDEYNWTFFSDSKTKIFASSENVSSQLNILKAFERTVYPKRKLEDYSYIDLRISEQIIVKEKYKKG